MVGKEQVGDLMSKREPSPAGRTVRVVLDLDPSLADRDQASIEHVIPGYHRYLETIGQDDRIVWWAGPALVKRGNRQRPGGSHDRSYGIRVTS
jgi:hypothetical protein